MSGIFEVQVRGLSELGDALRGFGQLLATKYLRRATFEAAKVIEEEAITRAPRRTGALADAIAIFRKRNSDPYIAHYAVGVRKLKWKKAEKAALRVLRGANQRARVIGDAYYWRFDEFGTAKMAARPFMRPALDSKKEAAIDRFKVSLAEGVEKASAEAKR